MMIAAVFAAATMGVSAQKPMTAPAGGKAISNELIGIFFEDINNSADGGLYAELLQNGSFEFSPSDRDGWGPGTAWKMIRPGHSLGNLLIRSENPVHPNNATYMRLHTERVKEYFDYKGWKGFGLQNDGFDGISVKAGEKYDFSAFMRNVDGGAKKVRVALVEQPQGWPPREPKLLAEAVIDVNDNNWKKYEAVLTPESTCQKASLQILVLNTGDMDIDVVSLMPEDTYKGHGLRKDLAQALADLQPKFLRFPGGCVVHGGGDGFWNTYRWKTTIGPKETRRQLKNTWGYHQSCALGYYEYFQFCEDLGMEPVPILPSGVSCQGANGGWNMWPTQAQDVVPMSEMDEWVAEAIDLIEWANGDPAKNKWAKMRADQGHPKPFNLKYLGIGNEEKISPEFIERFKYIYDDEHYYEPNDFFLNKRQYDNYPRNKKTKVYLGEYAAKDKKLIDALAEGLYLLHVERNADVVTMTSYAPLFAYYDNERPFLTCSYYVQQMFGQSSGNYYYGDCVKFQGDAANVIQPMENVHYGQSVILNTKTRQLFVKVVNATSQVKFANVNLGRFQLTKEGKKTVLAGNPYDENNFEKQPIAPKTEMITPQQKFTLDVAPYSMVMLQYQL